MIDDDVLARDRGADGVVLGGHGGRRVEPTISPMEILPEVRAALGPDFTISIDSGVRRGSGIVMARALGADAARRGRAALYGLAAALEILRTEIDRTLARIGVETVDARMPACLEDAHNARPARPRRADGGRRPGVRPAPPGVTRALSPSSPPAGRR